MIADVGTLLLFIPGVAAVDSIGHQIVIAWDGSRASTWAVNDALPLIELSEQVAMLNVDSGLHEQSAMLCSPQHSKWEATSS